MNTSPLVLASATRVIQLALTPVFLLTAIGSLLNVFTARLGRVADRVDLIAGLPAGRERQLRVLRLRSRLLDVAVVLATAAGALTCATAVTLFYGALREAATSTVVFYLFGGALVLLVAALSAFAGEMVLSGRAVREQACEAPDATGGGRASN